MARGVARFQAGDLEAARHAFHGAAEVGEPEAEQWIELLDLAPGP